MNIGAMTVTCDHIERVTPVKADNSPSLVLLLDDVDAAHLMTQLVSLMDPEQILDYLPDNAISEYLATQNTKLTPREQYERGYNGE